MHCKINSHIPGLYLVDVVCIPTLPLPHMWQIQISPDIFKCPLGLKTTPGWELLVGIKIWYSQETAIGNKPHLIYRFLFTFSIFFPCNLFDKEISGLSHSIFHSLNFCGWPPCGIIEHISFPLLFPTNGQLELEMLDKILVQFFSKSTSELLLCTSIRRHIMSGYSDIYDIRPLTRTSILLKVAKLRYFNVTFHLKNIWPWFIIP